MKILIVDDEKNLRQVLAIELSADGDEVDAAEDGVRALELLEKKEYDVVLLDLNMPRMGGIDVLKKMRALDMPAEVIVLTANTTFSAAVEAMKLGAYDYLTKPFRMEELTPVIEKAFEKKKLRSENLILKTQLERQQDSRRIVAKSPAMLELLKTVRKIAASDYPVLITGETGAGKELIAASIHAGSKRPDKPFIALNCAAIPESMVESELFGHEKGAFTGAQDRKLGLFELANKGTLFLDEIGDMPLALQAKLLRVIETKNFFRLGGIREQTVDIRIIAATNKDLKAEIARGSFRLDLFYRISPFIVKIIPLRDRTEDIPELVEYFKTRSPEFRHKQFSEEALAILSRYPWPGNVRELQNVLHRVLLLSTHDVVKPSDLPPDICGVRQAASDRLEDIEREHILKVLQASGGQRNRAAEALGIDPKTLYRKLAGYGVKE